MNIKNTKYLFIPPSDHERLNILKVYGFNYGRRICEEECSGINSISLSRRWRMKRQERFPTRCHFGRNSCD